MILRLSIFLIPALILAPALFGQQSRFDAATEQLEDQEYVQAISQYRSIAYDGYVSGALWLNMGVAYARLDSLGKAKYYLLQAREYPETEQLARESLETVNNSFSRRSSVLPLLPWERFIHWADQTFGVTGLMIIGLVLLNTGAGALLAGWFYPGKKTLFNYASIATGGLAILCMGLSIFINLQNEWYGTGVTVEKQTIVYDKPDPQSAEVSTAYEGYTMRVDRRKSSTVDGWHYIRLENGMYGWIEKEKILTF